MLGWPVAHSRSPAMHNAAFAALGLHRDWHYQRLPVPPHLFAETVRALPAAGFVGANVTIPHKHAALELARPADRSDAAREIGAANTLSFDHTDGTVRAENTDAPGLIAALPASPQGATALVLGAGGSARAAVWALRRAGAQVLLWNRTPERAQRLADRLGATVVQRPSEADLLINCTAVGLQRSASDEDALNQLQLTADLVARYLYVVDFVYSDRETPLLATARRHGVPTVDGIEILAQQGALSFQLWTGRPAPLQQMRDAARRR